MSDKSNSKLFDLVVRGTEYSEPYEVMLFGEKAEAHIKPLCDDKFLPLTGRLQEKFQIDDAEAIEMVENAKDELPEGEDHIDASQFDDEFVDIMQTAAILGIDHEKMGISEKEKVWMVEHMIGGLSVEIGSAVLDLSGDMADAEKFRR